MTRVGVRVRPAHLLPPPIITVAPSNLTVPIGERVALICRAWGADAVKWLFKDSIIRYSSRHKVLSDSTLTINGRLLFEIHSDFVSTDIFAIAFESPMI